MITTENLSRSYGEKPALTGLNLTVLPGEILGFAGLVGAEVTVTLHIEATVPAGAPDNVVRTVTENSRTLKFTTQGFEKE